MEMTNRRWIMLTVLLCAGLAAFRLPPSGRVRQLDWSQRARSVNQATIATSLRQTIMNLDEAATAIARRDSLLVTASSTGRTQPLVLGIENALADERQLIEDAVRAQAQAIGPNAGSLVLSVVLDTNVRFPMRPNFETERQFILPSLTGGKTCITILRVGRGRRPMANSDRAGIFGPCAYYAAFGTPGAGVEAWLRKRAYDVTLASAWPSSLQANPALLAPKPRVLKGDLQRWIDFGRSWRSLNVSACAGGDRTSCAKSLRDAEIAQRALPTGIVSERHFWGYESHLGNESAQLVADLLAEQGREKFARFWRSSGDAETAFKSTFGESTGEWTMKWMRYRYGPDQRGPYVSARSVVLGLLTSLALVGLCAVASTQRQFG